MSALTNGVKAAYNFLVGDMRILIGTLATVIVTGFLAAVLPTGAGLVSFLLLAMTLGFSLRHEIHP